MDNLEAVVVSSRSISHPHDPYEGVVSFLINEFAEGEQPWQVQQFSEGELIDSDYFNTEAEAEAWVAREATLNASVARHDLEQARQALAQMRAAYGVLHDRVSPIVEGDVVWSEAERAALADMLERCCEADAAARRALDAGDAPDASPSAPQTPDASALMLAALRDAPDMAAFWSDDALRPTFDRTGYTLAYSSWTKTRDAAIRAAEGREG